MNTCSSYLFLFACAAGSMLGQAPPAAGGSPASPDATASAVIGGKVLSIKYSAPSVRGRQIFGPKGLISNDATYPVWRAGANSATSFHTDADLTIGTLEVPRGDYTIYAQVGDPDNWQLIINKQTGQWGLTYDEKQDLGRVKMTMNKSPSLIEVFKITLAATGPKAGKLQLEWERHIASVPLTLH